MGQTFNAVYNSERYWTCTSLLIIPKLISVEIEFFFKTENSLLPINDMPFYAYTDCLQFLFARIISTEIELQHGK